MLNQLVAFSVRFRGVIVALSCLLLGYGLHVASRSKLDVFPEFAPPLIVIQTEAPGLSPEEVEKLITRKIEVSINGVANLETLRSQSIQGLSVVTAIFEESADIYRARQLVSERLSELTTQLPKGAGTPTMAPLMSSTGLVLVAGLTSESRSLTDIRTYAEWELKPRLLAVPGVAKVTVFGGDVRQLQINLSPQKLEKYGISIEEVAAAAGSATGVRGAGFIETPAQRIVLHAVGQSLDVKELQQSVVRRTQGLTVTLGDLAKVEDGAAPRIGAAGILGQPGVILMVSGQYGTNTLDVTEKVEKELHDLEPQIDAGKMKLNSTLFRPANFITTAISNVKSSLFLGAILVIVVLFLFLGNPRTALISATAIPLSLLLAIVILDLLGISLNTLTLGGLAIAIGEVVDDAIIDVENIFRRLKENAKSKNPLSKLKIVYDASIEVRSAVVYATFVVILVFIPVITMGGIQGRLFSPLGYAYILSILASLVVALTVTPALSAVLLSERTIQHEEPRWLSFVKDWYAKKLSNILKKPRKLVLIAVFLVLAAVSTVPFFGGAFLPEFKEGHFIIHMSAIPGTSLEESERIGQRVTTALLATSGVRSVAQRAGRAQGSDDAWGTHYSEFEVDLKPLGGEEAEIVQGEIRKTLSKFPGLSFALKPFLTERIEETITGTTAQVVVKIFGEDLGGLDKASSEVASLLSKIQGASEVQVESVATMPELSIKLRTEALGRLGFQKVAVLDAIQTAYQGRTVNQVFEGNRVFDVVVRLDEKERRAPEEVKNLRLKNPDGRWVRLSELAEITERTGRYAIFHESTLRRQMVSCNVGGRDVVSFTDELRKKLKEMKFPAGIYPVVSGAAEARTQGQRQLFIHSLAVAGLVILLLWIVFRRVRNLLLVLANLPFALVGGVLAVFFTGGWLSLGSLVGFVTLFGITTRNSIMLISHYEHLVGVEGESWDLHAALRGASERFVPIMMTALVTALGLLPIAIGSGESGREIEGPMAIVILGGLLTSTALNLLVLPTLALRFGRFERTEASDKL